MEPSHGLSNITYVVRQGESETSPAPRRKWVWHSVARGPSCLPPSGPRGRAGLHRPGLPKRDRDLVKMTAVLPY